MAAREAQPEPAPSNGKQRPVFTLLSNLCDGLLHSELKELYKKFKKLTKPRVEVDTNVSEAIAHLYVFRKL